MRPYLAVLKDAFREAFASFLLWLLLLVDLLALIVIAGFSLTDTLASDFSARDIQNEQQLATKLSMAAEKTPERRIWDTFTNRGREQITKLAGGGSPRPGAMFALKSILVNQLNVAIKENLYDPALWKVESLPAEAKKYVDKGVGKLTRDELKRLNRLLIDKTFPFHVVAASESQAKISFFWFELPPIAGVPPRELVGGVLVWFLRLVIGLGGMIVAIIVTSNTIPQMFEPGAIDLLLSKPVSRILLFLTRFVGGCSFVLILTAPLIAGIWVLAGVRMGLWYPKLFWCIPLLMFLFLIYYSISALSGVIWRNSIVSVLLTMLFMLFLMGTETYYSFVTPIFFDHIRLAHVVKAGDTLFGVERNGTAYVWKGGTWAPSFKQFDPQFGQDAIRNYPYAGPVYDPRHQRLAALESRGDGFGQFGGSGTLVVGDKTDDWHTVDSLASEFGVAALFATQGGDLITVGVQGVSKLEGDPTTKPRQPFLVFGRDLNQLNGNKAPQGPRWTSIGRDEGFAAPIAAAMAPDETLAVFSRGQVYVLTRQEQGRYKVVRERDLETSESGLIAISGETVAVVLANGRVILLDTSTLKTRHELKDVFPEEKPRQIALAADGRWLFVVTHERKFRSFDTQSGAAVTLPIRSRDDVSAISVNQDKLLVVTFYRRVTEYDVGSWKVDKIYDPVLTTWERANFYVVFPIYQILPKPGQMSNDVSNYLVTEKRSETLGREADLAATRITHDPWEALWSNLAFVGVVLSLASVYVWRKDF